MNNPDQTITDMTTSLMNFKQIEDLPYSINEHGMVYNHRRKTILKGLLNKATGYIHYQLMVKGKTYWRYEHRLVFKAFNGEIPFGYEIDHIDNNRQNNTLSNLQAVTRAENNNMPKRKMHPTKTMSKYKYNSRPIYEVFDGGELIFEGCRIDINAKLGDDSFKKYETNKVGRATFRILNKRYDPDYRPSYTKNI